MQLSTKKYSNLVYPMHYSKHKQEVHHMDYRYTGDEKKRENTLYYFYE